MKASELAKKIKDQDAEDGKEGKLGTTNNINVGDGLYLRRLPSGTRKWVFRYTNIAKKRVWFTIGELLSNLVYGVRRHSCLTPPGPVLRP